MTIAAAWTGSEQYKETYKANAASVPDSRRDLRGFLTKWGLAEDLSDTACLVASELVTNAVRHCKRGQSIEVQVDHCETDKIRIYVWDPCSAPVAPRRSTPSDENGRGLLLVDEVSSVWGSVPLPQGKIVWAEISSQ